MKVARKQDLEGDIMITQYILIVICTILSVSFFCGKGSWLIAGYNTMNDNDKQKYDYKKLCYVMGAVSQ